MNRFYKFIKPSALRSSLQIVINDPGSRLNGLIERIENYTFLTFSFLQVAARATNPANPSLLAPYRPVTLTTTNYTDCFFINPYPGRTSPSGNRVAVNTAFYGMTAATSFFIEETKFRTVSGTQKKLV